MKNILFRITSFTSGILDLGDEKEKEFSLAAMTSPATVREARDRAYAAADRISFANAHKRSDIASRAVDR